MISSKKLFSAAVPLLFILGSIHPAMGAKLDTERMVPPSESQPIPVEDFFRVPLLFQPRLNPSGTYIAALVTATEDKQSLLVVDLTTNKTQTIEGPGDMDVYGLTWLDDKNLLTSLSDNKLYAIGLFAQDVTNLSAGYPLIQFTSAQFIGTPLKTPLRPLVWIGSGLEDGDTAIGVCEIDYKLDTGKLMKAYAGSINQDTFFKARALNRRHILKTYPQPKESAGSGYNVNYIVDRSGELAFCIVGRKGFHTLSRFVDGDWVASPVDLEKFDVIGAGNETDQLVVRPLTRDGKPQPLQFINAATAELGEVLLQDKGYDADGFLYRDRKTGVLLGAQYTRARTQTVWFDEHYASVQKLLDSYFPGLVVSIMDFNETGELFLVSTRSDRQPAVFHWVNVAKQTVGLVKSSRPWIDPKRMMPMSMIKYKTIDGRQLDAYVTMPAGASKENPPPLIVLSHGGPWVRDAWGFDGEAQFLASRGYAVLQTNYRGSTGYDWMFPEEDRYAFRKMHADVTSAAKTLIKSGLVDARRVAIMGASFGAYLALSGVVHEPDLYRCAVVNAGVFDWEDIVKEAKYFQHSGNQYAYFIRKLGDPKTEKEKFDAISPIRHVANVRVPVFVAHGKDDPVAPIAQSRELVSNLKKHGIPHETLFKADEGHGMAHLAAQVELYTRIEIFLARNLGSKSSE